MRCCVPSLASVTRCGYWRPATLRQALGRAWGGGSDRKAERWRRDVAVPGTECVELHHLYRAMRWLGEAKDQIEEALFARRRDLFTELSLAFFAPTSLYFAGRGGESIGDRKSV